MAKKRFLMKATSNHDKSCSHDSDLQRVIQPVSLSVTTDEAIASFVQAMNQKCTLLGLTNTRFTNAHGLATSGQSTTAADLSKLFLQVCGISEILRVWGAKSYTVDIGGPHHRSVKVVTTVKNPQLEKEFVILGGKSGTLVPDIYSAAVLLEDQDNQLFAVIVLQSNSTTQRYLDAALLVKAAKKRQLDPNYQLPVEFQAIAGEVVQITNQPLFWTHQVPKKMLSLNEKQKIRPASLTKLMTVLLLTEHVSNLHERFTIQETDLVGGSGPRLWPGDTMSYWDALYLMMLPSANNVAQAISRVIGEKIQLYGT